MSNSLSKIYTDGIYGQQHKTWHAEDAPFKAREIVRILDRNQIAFESVIDVGCGVGAILAELQSRKPNAIYSGCDISAEAIERAAETYHDIAFFVCNNLLENVGQADLLIAADVFEHVPDYLGFCARCRELARYKAYHIPLDIHCSAVLRGAMCVPRKTVGHLHSFTKETAIATLEDTGHRIIDWHYTAGAFEGGAARSWKWRVANVPRRLVSTMSTSVAQRLLGGWSLIVIAE